MWVFSITVQQRRERTPPRPPHSCLSLTSGFTETRGNGPVPKHKLFPSPNDLLRGSPAHASGQFNGPAHHEQRAQLHGSSHAGTPSSVIICGARRGPHSHTSEAQRDKASVLTNTVGRVSADQCHCTDLCTRTDNK